MNPMMSEGDLFDGFHINRVVARGGSGVVYEARSPEGLRVAVKILDRETIESKARDFFESVKAGKDKSVNVDDKTQQAYEKYVDRFKCEYHALVGLNHPHIAKVHKIGFFENRLYIVSEFIEGESIAKHVRGWNPLDMVPLFVQCLEGFDYIHRNGLIHLDIKPDNILVQEIDGKPHVKIIDFGMAMTPEEYKGTFLGTIDTMAPEVAMGLSEKVDARADLFSFGMVMYYCITWGSFPYARTRKTDRDVIRRLMEREAKLRPDPPSCALSRKKGFATEFLDTIVMRLVAHNPEDRFYCNARAVINALVTHAPDAFKDAMEWRGSYLAPENNKHIGHQDDMEVVCDAIRRAAEGERSQSYIFWIRGERGMGKTHFLQKVKEYAERYVERISVLSMKHAMQENVERLSASALPNDSDWSLAEEVGSETKPLLFLVDDAKPNTSAESDREVLTSLIRLLSQPGITGYRTSIILCFSSNADDETFDTLRKKFGMQDVSSTVFKEIILKPFTYDRLREYLASTTALKGKNLPQEWVEMLYRQTSGVPVEIKEYLAYLDNHGVLFGLDGEIVVAELEAAHSHIGRQLGLKTTAERLQKQYNMLSPFEREVVDLMALWNWKRLTKPITIDDLHHFISNAWLAQTLNALEHQNILISFPQNEPHDSKIVAYGFTNDLMPDHIIELLSDEKRRRLHDEIADYIGDDGDAAALHRIFGENAGSATVIRRGVISGRRLAFKIGRPSLGKFAFQRLLELSSKRDKLAVYLMCLLINTYYRLGALDEAGKTYERATEQVSSLGKGKREWSILLLLNAVPVFIALRQYEKAAESIAEAKALHGKQTDTYTWLTFLNYEARIFFDRRAESVEYLEKAKQIYEKSAMDERKLSAESRDRIANNELGKVLFTMGVYDKAVPELETKSRRDMNAGDSYNAIVSLLTLANAHRMQREFDKAMQHAERARSTAVAKGYERMLPYVHEVKARLLHDMDRFDEAADEYRRSLAASSFLEDDKERSSISQRLWLNMGHCYKELGKLDDSIVHFEAVMQEDAGDELLMSAYEGAGEAYYGKGDFDKSFSYFDKADEILEKLPRNAVAVSHKFRIIKLRMEIHLKKGEPDKAAKLIQLLKANTDGDESREQECLEIEKRIENGISPPTL